MKAYDIILKKRNGGALTDEEIRFFVNGVVDGSIPDYQATAFLMAVYFRGMTDEETVCLTDAMMRSGDVVDLSRFGKLTVDKHSTGGVGDKTSLIVAPIVGSLGLKLAKMSGRGLGHTGGTVDKLESIPGYRTDLPSDAFLKQVEKTNVAVIGQTGNMVPADKILYSLRDVTATVDSIPLITSSIMSKKLAAGAHTIVLDVKTGSGAFMKTPADARVLAEKMVLIGKACGRKMAALITDMDTPLGTHIGNALEVQEAVAVLKGRKNDLFEVSLALASNIASLALELPIEEAKERCLRAVESGAAFEKMKDWIGSQGGDVRFLDDTSLFPPAKYEIELRAENDGYISHMDAEKLGLLCVELGAGRRRKEDAIDFSAGLILNAKTGDKVQKGDLLATAYTSIEGVEDVIRAAYGRAVTFSDTAPEQKPLIYDVIS
ncbi:MAG: thymidine phosphorylase [Clostridia bacterium]|nr:thymidine phosphorylase [Clostridia bacterium]